MEAVSIIMVIVAGILLSVMAANRKRTVEESSSTGIYEEAGASDESTASSIDPDEKRTLTISREPQILNSLGRYKVTVNGELIGKLAGGESLACNITEKAYVQIQSGKNGASMHIRAGKAPSIHFTTLYGGAITVTGDDLEILDIQEGI